MLPAGGDASCNLRVLSHVPVGVSPHTMHKTFATAFDSIAAVGPLELWGFLVCVTPDMYASLP